MSLNKTEKICELLQHPSDEYTPIPFWFWNDEADEGKI